MGTKKSTSNAKKKKTATTKATSAGKAASSKKSAPSAAAHPLNEGGLRGEREQLAALRDAFPPLTLEESDAFLATSSPETCRAKGTGTKARDVVRMAVAWARTLGENPADAAVNPKRARWFLDCTSALAELVAGNTILRNPSVTTVDTEAYRNAVDLTVDVRRAAKRALGDDGPRLDALMQALKPEARDAKAEALRATKGLLEGWLREKGLGLRLRLQDITPETTNALEAAAKALDDAAATKRAATQIDRDSPAENEAEGRLLFAMKWLWDDFKAARRKGKSALTLQVSPAILRGLGIGRSGEADDADDEAAPTT